jgi:regulator of sirC expression with transglutaminase-like and TPR domain
MSQVELGPFAELVTRDEFDLARACFMIAQDAYPALDIDHELARLDALAATIRARVAADAFAEQKVVALNHYLFGELGFAGNTESYYDPRNSYLNDVIERRVGIPITLSVLYMEIGRRIGLPLQGVSFPGHFLVKLRVRRGQLVLDPFAGGEPLGESDLRDRLAAAVPGASDVAVDRYLDAASAGDIITRVLRNLKAIHMQAGRLDAALQVLNRILLAAPHAVQELRDRGLVYAKLECFRPALGDLQNYLRRAPEAADAPEIRGQVVELQAKVARLN